jgi:hypothetical protein
LREILANIIWLKCINKFLVLSPTIGVIIFVPADSVITKAGPAEDVIYVNVFTARLSYNIVHSIRTVLLVTTPTKAKKRKMG